MSAGEPKFCAPVSADVGRCAWGEVKHNAQLHVELEHLGALTALALRESLWQFEVEQAKSIMEAAFINPGVVSIGSFVVILLPPAASKKDNWTFPFGGCFATR